MTETITNAMLRKALSRATNTEYINTGTGGNVTTNNTTPSTTGTNNSELSLSEKKINKVKGNTLMCKDGTKATLYSPVPCLHWKCLSRADDKGVCLLTKEITGLILTYGKKNYCIGIKEATQDFEIRMHVGKNEVRLNNEFLNLMAEHIVLNGLEVKEEDDTK